MATYRAAVIGAGSISPRHIKSWQDHPDVDLVAVVDIDEAKAKSRSEEFGIPNLYTDYRKMLDREKPELVSVCTWMIGHADQTVVSIEAGAKAILCEKPFAGSLEEVDRVLQAADRHGARVALGHHHRFSKVNEEARRLIEAGEIGAPTICPRSSAGGLFNNASHAVDLVRYMLRDPGPTWALGQVVRNTDRHERHAPIEDICGGIIALEGGARIVLESDLPEPKAPEEATAVYGTEGVLLTFRKGGLRLLNAKTGASKHIDLEAGDVGGAQARELVDWLEGRVESHRNNAHNNRTSIEILLGLYESARSHNLVSFPMPSGPSPLLKMIDEGHLKVVEPGKYDIRIKS